MRVLKKVAFKYWMMRAYEAVDHGDSRAALEMALRASDFASVAEHRKELGYLFYGLDWVNHSLGQFQLGMHSDRLSSTSAAPYRCYDVQERIYQELLESGRLDAREDLVDDVEDPAGRHQREDDLPERVWGRIGMLHDNLHGRRRPVLEPDHEGHEEAEQGHDLVRRVEQSLRHEGSCRAEAGGRSSVVDLRRYRRRREDREMAAFWGGQLDTGRAHSRPTRRGRS